MSNEIQRITIGLEEASERAKKGNGLVKFISRHLDPVVILRIAQASVEYQDALKSYSSDLLQLMENHTQKGYSWNWEGHDTEKGYFVFKRIEGSYDSFEASPPYNAIFEKTQWKLSSFTNIFDDVFSSDSMKGFMNETNNSRFCLKRDATIGMLDMTKYKIIPLWDVGALGGQYPMTSRYVMNVKGFVSPLITEQYDMPKIVHLLPSSSPMVWLIFDLEAQKVLTNHIRQCSHKFCKSPLLHNSIAIPFDKMENIPYQKIIQYPGEMMIIGPGVVYQMGSKGPTLYEETNFFMKGYSPIAMQRIRCQCEKKYAEKNQEIQDVFLLTKDLEIRAIEAIEGSLTEDHPLKQKEIVIDNDDEDDEEDNSDIASLDQMTIGRQESSSLVMANTPSTQHQSFPPLPLLSWDKCLRKKPKKKTVNNDDDNDGGQIIQKFKRKRRATRSPSPSSSQPRKKSTSDDPISTPSTPINMNKSDDEPIISMTTKTPLPSSKSSTSVSSTKATKIKKISQKLTKRTRDRERYEKMDPEKKKVLNEKKKLEPHRDRECRSFLAIFFKKQIKNAKGRIAKREKDIEKLTQEEGKELTSSSSSSKSKEQLERECSEAREFIEDVKKRRELFNIIKALYCEDKEVLEDLCKAGFDTEDIMRCFFSTTCKNNEMLLEKAVNLVASDKVDEYMELFKDEKKWNEHFRYNENLRVPWKEWHLQLDHPSQYNAQYDKWKKGIYSQFQPHDNEVEMEENEPLSKSKKSSSKKNKKNPTIEEDSTPIEHILKSKNTQRDDEIEVEEKEIEQEKEEDKNDETSSEVSNTFNDNNHEKEQIERDNNDDADTMHKDDEEISKPNDKECDDNLQVETNKIESTQHDKTIGEIEEPMTQPIPNKETEEKPKPGEKKDVVKPVKPKPKPIKKEKKTIGKKKQQEDDTPQISSENSIPPKDVSSLKNIDVIDKDGSRTFWWNVAISEIDKHLNTLFSSHGYQRPGKDDIQELIFDKRKVVNVEKAFVVRRLWSNKHMLSNFFIESYFKHLQAATIGKTREIAVVVTQTFEYLGSTKSYESNLVTISKNNLKSAENLEYIFAPILHARHWLLFVVDIDAKTFFLYDSLYGGNKNKIPSNNNFRRRIGELKKLISSVLGDNFINWNEWSTSPPENTNFPKQSNLTSCGIYICHFASQYMHGLRSHIQCTDDQILRELLLAEMIDAGYY